jgi:hypothetical protein
LGRKVFRVCKGFRELQGRKALRERRVWPGLRVLRETWELPGLRGLPGRRERRALLARWELLGLREFKVLRA